MAVLGKQWYWESHYIKYNLRKAYLGLENERRYWRDGMGGQGVTEGGIGGLYYEMMTYLSEVAAVLVTGRYGEYLTRGHDILRY